MYAKLTGHYLTADVHCAKSALTRAYRLLDDFVFAAVIIFPARFFFSFHKRIGCVAFVYKKNVAVMLSGDTSDSI